MLQAQERIISYTISPL